MELKQLNELVMISQCGTLSNASKELHISQPALSRSMQRLEEELNVELFDHYKNKIILNETGELVIGYASKILEDAETLKKEALKLYNSVNELIVGSCTPAPVWDLMPILDRLYNVSVSCHVICNEELISNLKSKQCNLVITRTEENDPDILCIPYIEESLMLSVAQGDPLYDHETVKYHDLDNTTMLMYENNGFWGPHHMTYLPNTKFIVQKDRSTFLQIKNASTLPCFTTNLSIKREGPSPNRKAIPFDEDTAQVDFYLCLLKKDQNKYKDLIKKVENYFDY